MDIAIEMAKRGLGTTAPNPSVGCVIVKDNNIIAKACTAKNGRPHAERIALEQAGAEAVGADIYVTLEPCSHYGKTPPCADAIIAAKAKRVIIANIDINPEISGNGVKKLKDAGIEVIVGVCEEKALEVNYGFFKTQKLKLPKIILKLGTSLDGKIALSNYKSHYVTGEAARRYSHFLRAKNDAILVGKNTYIQDKPQLNCRLEGLEEQSPKKIVLGEIDNLEGDIINFPSDKPLKTILHELVENYGITSILVEGGAKIAASFIKDNLVDEIHLTKSAKIFGSDAISAIGDLGIEEISEAYFKLHQIKKLGDDTLIIFRSKSWGQFL